MTLHHSRTLRTGFVATLRDVVRDKGVLMLLFAAPLFYAFFYPWFFGPEVVTRVPVAVIDLDVHQGNGTAAILAGFAAHAQLAHLLPQVLLLIFSFPN